MLRHQRVEKSDGEQRQPDKHNSMLFQLYVWHARRQVAMVMSTNSFAEMTEDVMKTIDLKAHLHSHHHTNISA